MTDHSSDKNNSIDKNDSNDKNSSTNKKSPDHKTTTKSKAHHENRMVKAEEPMTAFPTMPKIPRNRPWLEAYERYGISPTIDMPEDNTSLLDIFERNFRRYGQKPAYICMGASISFKQLDLYSRQIASYLQSLGLKKGDKVGVMMPNILQYPIVALGIIRAGIVLVNINPLYTSRELSHQLPDSDVKALFIVENFAKTYQEAKDKGQVEHVIVCKLGDMLGMVKGLVVKGYWKRDDATAESMTEDGFFRTGDIGIMDDAGYISIVDRKKNMILVSGFNVYPNEVEEVMAGHPKILECGVIGIEDEKSGETPKIYVVRKDSSLTEKDVLAYAKEHLTGYKRPRHVEFIDELPKSNVGKILHKDLRKLEEKNHAK